MTDKELFTPEAVEIIKKILKRGDSVELKKERDNLVIVELKRQVKTKTPTIG